VALAVVAFTLSNMLLLPSLSTKVLGDLYSGYEADFNLHTIRSHQSAITTEVPREARVHYDMANSSVLASKVQAKVQEVLRDAPDTSNACRWQVGSLQYM